MDSLQSQFQNSNIYKPFNYIKQPDNKIAEHKEKLNTKPQSDNFVKSDAIKNKEQKENKLSKWPWIATATIATAATLTSVGLLVAKYRNSKATQLAEHIDFSPAKTLEEAIEFGKKTFGIEEYSGFEAKDTDVVNFINEGIVNTSNFLKGKIRLPKKILYLEEAGTIKASVVTEGENSGLFVLNKNIYSNIDNTIDHYFFNLETSNTVFLVDLDTNKWDYKYSPLFEKEAIEPFIQEVIKFKSGKYTTYKQKLSLFNSVNNAIEAVNSINRPLKYIKKFLSKEENKSICSELNIPTDIEQIKQMSKEEQRLIIKKIIKNTKDSIKLDFDMNAGSPFSTIYHELGHIQDMKPRCLTTNKFDFDYSKYPKELKDWVDNKENMEIAGSISEYATHGPGEFIAEFFAKIVSGETVSNEAKALYKKLGGPKIPLNE